MENLDRNLKKMIFLNALDFVTSENWLGKSKTFIMLKKILVVFFPS